MRAASAIALLCATGCIVPLPGPVSQGPIRFVQRADDGAAANPNAYAFSLPSAPGNTVLVTLLWEPNTAPIPVVSDDHGNTYTLAVGPTNGAGALGARAGAIAVASSVQGGGGPLSLQISSAGQTFLESAAAEYSGVSGVDATGFASAASTMSMSASLTTAQGGDLLVGWAVSQGHVSAGAGFNSRDTVNGDMIEEGPAATPGPYTVTASSTTDAWLLLVAALRPSASL
jgi:hypothetical protein